MSQLQEIDLSSELTIGAAFRFPLQSAASRTELIKGALWLFVPVIGWLMNMGHRIVMTHRMQHGHSAWPAWTNNRDLLRHGTITFLGMAEYHAPAVVCGALAHYLDRPLLYAPAAALWIGATLAVPGYMSHYCFTLDPREVFDPFRALRRVLEGGSAYWHAWSIAFLALILSFFGLLAFGVGFLASSVWFWQVAGFSFAVVFTRKFRLRPCLP